MSLRTSRPPTDSTPSPNDPPNGGWLAWAQVLGAFLVSFCTMGLANSFGVFQSYYGTHQLSSYPPSSIAWIGTTQGLLLNTVGVLSGVIYDMGFIRPLIYTGCVLSASGFVAASFAGSYASIMLSLGVTVGLGSGVLYVPSLAIVAAYFTTKRPLATAVCAAGIGVGGAAYPAMFRALVDAVGFAWTCRVFALLNGVLLLASCLLITPRTTPRPDGQERKLFDFSSLKQTSFTLFCIALFFAWLTVDIPFYFLPAFVQEKLGLSASMGDNLLAIMNACSLIGRLLLGLLAVYFSPLLVWLLALFVSSVINLQGMVGFVVLYGFFTGGVVSLVSPAMLVFSPDISVVGSRLGVASIFMGVGFFIGPPIGGAVESASPGYLGASIISGSSYLIATIIMGLAYILHRRSMPGEDVENYTPRVLCSFVPEEKSGTEKWPKSRASAQADTEITSDQSEETE
ncbi:major facilitator superfamily domain-containing protein [Xylariales sp. PMI_506]|nr:major facilitator superfamily domain-containing protein [Xylariales sp. PMI_506]